MTTYTVYVGNIGTVCTTTVETLAREQFNEWVEKAKLDTGRASGEAVVLSADGEPIDEHEPSIIGYRDDEAHTPANFVPTLPQLYFYRPIAMYEGRVLKCAGMVSHDNFDWFSRSCAEAKDSYLPGVVIVEGYKGDRISTANLTPFED